MEITTTPDERELMENIQLSVDFSKLKIKAQMTAIKDKLTQYYKKLIDEGMYDEFHPSTENIMRDVKSLRETTNNVYDVKQGKSTHGFFTVNFKPEMKCMAEADEVIKKYLTKSNLIKDYTYAIEQRSEEGEPEGIHAHILFDKIEAPSKYKTGFVKHFFDKYVGTHAALDFRYVSGESVRQKTEYIMGFKTKEKMPKVLHDRRIKKGLRISDYTYTEGHRPLIEQILTEMDASS